MADDKTKPATTEQQAAEQQQRQLAHAAREKDNPDSAAQAQSATTATASPQANIKPQQSSKTQPRPAANTAKDQSQPRGQVMLWLITVLNLFLLTSLLIGAYWLWQQWQQQDSGLQQQVLQLTSRSQSQHDLSQRLQQQIQGQNQAWQTELTKLQQQQQQLSQQTATTQQHIAALSGRRPADWLVAEADHLVKMAGRKVWLEHDINTAIMLLQTADSRLQDLADPSLLPLRQLLATDIAGLQQLNPVSLSSVALSLSALVQQVDNLAVDTIPLPAPAEPKADLQLSASTADWRQNLAKTWQRIAGYFVTVTKRNAPVRPYLSAQQQWLAKEQLKQALMQGQMAVMREQADLYQQSLQLALSQLIAQFDLTQPSVKQFIDSVQRLLDTNIQRSYPASFQVAEPLAETLSQRSQANLVNGATAL